MDTSSSDDSYQSDGEMRRKILKEPVPGNVDFYFLKTGKSKSEGVLITHSDNFKFTKNNVNRNGTLHYYACALKLTYIRLLSFNLNFFMIFNTVKKYCKYCTIK